MSYEQLLVCIKNAGFSGIDFSFSDSRRRAVNDAGEYEKEIYEKLQMVKKERLAVKQTHMTYWPSNLQMPGDGSYEAFRAFMLPIWKKEIELTARMQCSSAVIHLYYEADKKQSRKNNIGLISELLPLLEKYKVTLAIENIYGDGENYTNVHLSTADDLLFYTEYFNSPYVGICLDTGHAIICGQSPEEMLKRINGKLAAVHLHTTVKNMDLHAIPYFSSYSEQINWRNFYRELSEIGYKGAFNLEVYIPGQLNSKAVEHFYGLAFEVANDIVEKKGSGL